MSPTVTRGMGVAGEGVNGEGSMRGGEGYADSEGEGQDITQFLHLRAADPDSIHDIQELRTAGIHTHTHHAQHTNTVAHTLRT